MNFYQCPDLECKNLSLGYLREPAPAAIYFCAYCESELIQTTQIDARHRRVKRLTTVFLK
jgi:hypothetical protein